MSWLYRLLGSMLSFFESFLGSYALALFLYALVFKILFLPFSIKQQKNQIALAKLTPKIELIKAKYKGRNDQPTMQKQQQEIMELQQKEGYSPFSGCLPLLLQLPLIMLLYTVIQNPLSYIAKTTDDIKMYNENVESKDDKIEMDDIILDVYNEVYGYMGEDKKDSVPKNTEISVINQINKYVNEEGADRDARIAKIEELGLKYESIPNFMLFGKINLAETPSFSPLTWLTILPILVAGIQWLTMWLTRKLNKTGIQGAAEDKQARASFMMMDLMMPAMTLFFAFSMPAMLGVYWIFQSALGLGQSYILAKAMPLPKFTEEDIKALKKAQREAEKSQKQAMKSQPKHRSLHYIDDDDYDVLPESPTAKTEENKNISGDIPDIKD